MGNAHIIFMGKPEDKGQFGMSKCRREDNIKRDFSGMGFEVMGWINLVEITVLYRALTNVTVNAVIL
jgi:hypothetical protein